MRSATQNMQSKESAHGTQCHDACPIFSNIHTYTHMYTNLFKTHVHELTSPHHNQATLSRCDYVTHGARTCALCRRRRWTACRAARE